MSKIKNYLRANPTLVIGLATIIIVVCYSFYKRSLIKKYGVITIARVDKFEGAEQGVDLHITIFYRGREYKDIVDSWCNRCIGKYYFIKILPSKPESNPVFYADKPVPGCLIDSVPFDGWKAIPVDSCK